jgi:hypothetical protein
LAGFGEFDVAISVGIIVNILNMGSDPICTAEDFLFDRNVGFTTLVALIGTVPTYNQADSSDIGQGVSRIADCHSSTHRVVSLFILDSFPILLRNYWSTIHYE